MNKHAPSLAKYEKALHQMLDENEAQRREIANLKEQLTTLVNWVQGDANALTTLQSVYLNPDEPAGNRIKAAAAAIGYEQPKLAATANLVIDFRERVRRARLKADAKLIERIPETEPKTIEHEPEPVSFGDAG